MRRFSAQRRPEALTVLQTLASAGRITLNQTRSNRRIYELVGSEDHAGTRLVRPQSGPYKKTRAASPIVHLDSREPLIVFGDIHAPLHCIKAIRALLNLCKDRGIKLGIVPGDLYDFACLSLRFAQEAARVLGGEWSVWREASVGREVLLEMLEVLDAIEFVPGNHEGRLPVWVNQNPAWCDHPGMTLPEVVRVPDGVRMHDFHTRLMIGRLCIEHGDDLTGCLSEKHGAAKVLTDMASDFDAIIYGHTHRVQTARWTEWGGNGQRIRTATSVGHLSDVAKQTWIHRPRWQQGAAIVTFIGDSPRVEALEIHDGTVVYGGQQYAA